MQSFFINPFFLFAAGAAKDAKPAVIFGRPASLAFYGMLNGIGAISLKTRYNTNYSHQGSADSWGLDYIFDASRCSTVYGNSTTVQPTSLTLKPLIKYI